MCLYIYEFHHLEATMLLYLVYLHTSMFVLKWANMTRARNMSLMPWLRPLYQPSTVLSAWQELSTYATMLVALTLVKTAKLLYFLSLVSSSSLLAFLLQYCPPWLKNSQSFECSCLQMSSTATLPSRVKNLTTTKSVPYSAERIPSDKDHTTRTLHSVLILWLLLYQLEFLISLSPTCRRPYIPTNFKAATFACCNFYLDIQKISWNADYSKFLLKINRLTRLYLMYGAIVMWQSQLCAMTSQWILPSI